MTGTAANGGARAILADLRAGRIPDVASLKTFAAGLANGEVSDAQAGAFAMAVCTGPGLGEAGRVALTEAMRDTGDTLSWDAGPVIDKHSTGGVGDCVSLILAPLLAAVGGVVPMISGRGLGHTGGTLDKLDSIPGIVVETDEAGLRRTVGEAGCAIVAATGRIAPADRRLYAVRDVTATVDQIDLIVASILSKKLAAGLGALVLDVKCGTGAFMRDRASASDLARALVSAACGAGCPSAALVTAMDEPLAPACGNALEVSAAIEVLTGTAAGPLREVTLSLGSVLMVLSGMASNETLARDRLEQALSSGAAAERFGAMVRAQGGPPDILERWTDILPGAPVARRVSADRTGVIAGVDGAALGHIVTELGGGRSRESDRIDPSVGLSDIVRIGTYVGPGDPLARIHAASDPAADRAEAALRAAIHLADAADPPPLILETIR